MTTPYSLPSLSPILTWKMLWSVQTGPNWLDRLRSSKGFPADDGLDLDHFLFQSSFPPTTPIILAAKPVRPDPVSSEPDDDEENTGICGTLTNVLAELFNFEVKQPISKKKQKKSARKPRKPRICVLNSEKYSNNGSDDGKFVDFQDEKGNDINVKNVNGIPSNENDGGDLLGYSRTEVTVIDTSFDRWKFDKVLYRRENVWKARDKKGKPKDAGRKRKKEIANDGNEEDSNKKHKVLRNENDKRDDARPQTPETLGLVSKKRSSFFRKSRQDTIPFLSAKSDKHIVLDTKGHHSKFQAKPSSCIKEKSQTLIDQ